MVELNVLGLLYCAHAGRLARHQLARPRQHRLRRFDWTLAGAIAAAFTFTGSAGSSGLSFLSGTR